MDACEHCRKPIARCEEFPVHAGCGSGYGWIHLEPNWGHSCQPRSGAPYAQPATACPPPPDRQPAPASCFPGEAGAHHRRSTMSKAEPMRISRRLDLLKATGRKHWTPAQFRRYMQKTLHSGAPYWPFPGEENPGGKNRPTPRQRKPRRDA